MLNPKYNYRQLVQSNKFIFLLNRTFSHHCILISCSVSAPLALRPKGLKGALTDIAELIETFEDIRVLRNWLIFDGEELLVVAMLLSREFLSQPKISRDLSLGRALFLMKRWIRSTVNLHMH